MRVMRWDAWCSMIVYTFATITFYLLGAAILWRSGLNPQGSDMIRTLGVMYEPVFGTIARWIFLFGAFAVLYSTLFVAAAGLARSVPDALRVMGVGPQTPAAYRRWVRVFGGVFPFVCVTIYVVLPAPAELVLLSGVMQGVMLPMLAGSALYFRYRRSDARLTPGLIWDLLLWASATGMLITGIWTCWSKLSDLLGILG
jgi:Mn2+/Fe2+ NRAMP family transporter